MLYMRKCNGWTQRSTLNILETVIPRNNNNNPNWMGLHAHSALIIYKISVQHNYCMCVYRTLKNNHWFNIIRENYLFNTRKQYLLFPSKWRVSSNPITLKVFILVYSYQLELFIKLFIFFGIIRSIQWNSWMRTFPRKLSESNNLRAVLLFANFLSPPYMLFWYMIE